MLSLFFLSFACSDVKDDHDHDHEHEVMTTVILDFTDADGGTSQFQFIDLQDGNTPTTDSIAITSGTYTVDISIFNELETPTEDVTPEISDEADEHQFFFSGDVEGCTDGQELVSHDYGDTDSSGFPIGLTNTITTLAAGSGDLIVSLRHLAFEDGQQVKTATLENDFCSGGTLPGDWDFQVTFPLTITE